MMDVRTSFALLVGTVDDAVASPSTLRAPVSVRLAGIGTPPMLADRLWARSVTENTFVIGADSGSVPLDHDDVGSPDPRHLAGTFDLHVVIGAAGYDDLPVAISCNHDAIPIARAFSLQPRAIAVRGRVTSGNPPIAVGGTTVAVTAIVPSAALPPSVVSAPDGTFLIPSVPAARSLTLTAGGTSETIAPAYPAAIIAVNFAL
jgi:hypothetical protein